MHVGWPQGILLAILFFDLGVYGAKHGQPRDPHDFWTALISTGLMVGLLYWGGFFG